MVPVLKESQIDSREFMALRNKSKIAFIHPSGLTLGGTERWLQMIAANLPKEEFEIDYFYSSGHSLVNHFGKSLPNQNVAYVDSSRVEYLKNNGVRLMPFKLLGRKVNSRDLKWIDTNFWDVFDSSKYELIQTAKAGRWYPYYKLKNLIVEFVSLVCSPDLSPNIAHSIHLSNWQRQKWISQRPYGIPADALLKKSSIIPIPTNLPNTNSDFRKELNIPTDSIVCGFHQRNDENIFSKIPLKAFSRVFNHNLSFIILGGANKYRDQAKKLGLKNVYFLEHTGDENTIAKFLNTLDIYTHGRNDGETFGTIFAEAMSFRLPCISHYSFIGANAQPETMGPGGIFTKNEEEYFFELKRLIIDKSLRNNLGNLAKKHSKKYYGLEHSVRSVHSIYENILNKTNHKEKLNKYFYGWSPLGFLYYGKLAQNEIAWHVATNQIPEEYEVEVAKYFLPEVKGFIDIGCNTGLYCCVAASMCPESGVIHAFDPQKECIDTLKQTISLNRWEKRLYAHNYGIGEKRSKLQLQLSGSGSTFNSDFNSDSSLPHIEVEVLSLDEWIKDNPLENVDFIKVDVEGYELEVLKGSENTIKSFKPVIFIEIAKKFLSRNFINQDYQVTLNWFKKNGYFVKRFNHYGKFVNTDKGTVPDGVSMYLAIHSKNQVKTFQDIQEHISNYRRIKIKNKVKHHSTRLKSTLKYWNQKYL